MGGGTDTPGDDLSPLASDAERGAEALTVLVPVYNEADNIRPLIAELERHVPPPFVVLVIFDFDEDTTAPVVRELARSRPWLRLLKNTVGPGVANALWAGFAAVQEGPVLVVMGDLSDDLSVVPKMLDLYRQGYLVVCASRYMKGGRQIGGPFFKRIFSRCAGLSLRYLAGFPTHDATNNFRMYDARLVQELRLESRQGFEVALELTAKAFRRGAPIAEVPTIWRERSRGASRFRLAKWLPAYLRWYRYALGL
jgi:glycosyltransferase involved in cell wall biosynthesis